MKKITTLLLLMMFITSSALLGQMSSDNAISSTEKQMMNKRRAVNPNAQTLPIPAERLRAKSSTAITVPSQNRGTRAISNINLSVTVDSWWGEASYNIWDYDAGAYYWATDKTFSYGGENQVWVLPLTTGSNYDVDCYDTYGDGGIGGVVTNDDTGWPITDWGAGDYTSYGAFGFTAGLGMQPVDITTFPFTEDFESGSAPPEFVITTGSGSDVFVSASAAAPGGNYGLLYEGNTSSGWGSTPYSYSAAFAASKSSHFGTVTLTIVPDGSPGNMTMIYDFMQGYSFNVNYSWFRALVNGNPLYDSNGDYYWQPNSHSDNFQTLEFDLSSYQVLGNFDITLQSSCKYYENYYQQGDIAFLDNFELFYLTIGDVEGYVLNGLGLSIAGATVWMDGYPSVETDASGYYFLSQVAGEWQDVNCYRDGYNLQTDNFYITPSGTTTHDFTLTRPNFTINPLFFDETLNPNEYLTKILGILNTGDGPGDWEAIINYFNKAPGSSNATNVTGQTYPATPAVGNQLPALVDYVGEPLEPSNKSRDLFECNAGSLFGNSPYGATNAFWSQYGGTYQQYQQVNGVSEDWTTVTFWGVYLSGTPVTEDFFIGVYEDNGSTYGAEIASYVIPLDPIATGEVLLGSYPIWQYIAVIDAQTASDFWISCQATSQMYWLTSEVYGTGNSTANGIPLAVCIEGAAGFTGWLTLGDYEGTVPGNGGGQNVDVNFDATGGEPGGVYTAEIVMTTDPDVATFTIPVTMTIFGDPLTPVTDLEVTLINEVTGQVSLTWLFASRVTFQYFLIKRDGTPVGTTTDLFYTDFLPTYGTYCYTVTPVFDEGNGVPAGPECTEWFIPALCWSPATMYNEQWPDTQEEVMLTLENCGDGTLAFEFPDYTSGSKGFSCDMEIWLYDSFGDGWNGGTLDVLVNGVVVLDDITLASGSGPEAFSFPVENGDDLSTVFTPGGWPYECSYEFYDGDGNLIYTSPYNNLNLAPGTVFGTCPQPSYIIDVEPAMGTIASGTTLDITLTYTSTGFPAGLYDEWLQIETNDPAREFDSIFNQMLVYIPGMLYGTVTDCNSGQGLSNVTVTAYGAEEFSTETDGSGYYELYVDEDTYDIYFDLLGFESSFVGGVFAPTGVGTEVNTTMCETPYPVNWVYADPNEADTECMVTWTLPMGPYEIIYDDGEADDYVVWTQPGGAVGVHFTPAGYPATVLGGRLNVGDGSFPAGGNFLGTQMAIGLFDDDGAGGMPGTQLDSVAIDVTNYGWVDFYGIFGTTITEGDFYIVMWQLGWAANSAPCAIDTDLPTVYRSAVMMPGGAWTVSPYQDFMIRAYVSGPNAGVVSNAVSSGQMVRLPKVIEGPFLATSMPKGISGTVKDGEFRPVEVENATRDLTNYTIARASNFDPDLGPQTGTLTPLSNPTTESYNDAAFGGLDPGFYAYAVKAIYESNESIWVYSNVVAHGLDNEFTVNVSLCDGNDPDNAEVTLIGQTYPYHVWFGLTDIDGVVVFDSVIDGTYDLYVNKVGYTLYEHLGLQIFDDMTYSLVLTEKAYPPRNLAVDSLTSKATWDEPLITALYPQGFNDPTFPPAGWQSMTAGQGWYRSDDAGTGAWAIPPGDGFYAVANDDAAGSTNPGEDDYLITPELDLREASDFGLEMSHFFDAAYGQSAYVEYSFDGGATWEVLESMSPVTDWTDVTVDLSSLSGLTSDPVWIAFHSDDNGNWGSGWAIDNVVIRNGPSPIQGYYVYLDDAWVGQTAVDVREWTYMDLAYGETYEGCVRALYACGLSEPICITWQSFYLHPPRNLGDEYIYGTNEVPLMWNPPMTGVIPMTSAFSVVYVGPQLQVVGPNDDAADEVTIVEYENAGSGRDMGDLQFTFNTVDNSGEAGCESDGIYVYTVLWNGSNYFRYDLDGNLLETFTIAGTSSVRDLAYDGEFMYGAAASTTVYVMDFETQTLVTSFTAPTAVRAIAYNEDDQTFYGNNWGTDIVNFNSNGDNLGSFTPTVTSIYGLAFDKWSDPGNIYLWAYDQGANDLTQYNLPDGTPTGLTINANAIAGATAIAGGAYTQPALWAADKVTIGGNAQNEMMWGIELADYDGGGGGGGMIPDGLVSFNLYRDGVNIANIPYEDQEVDEWVTYVDNNLDPAVYLYDVSAVYDLTIFGYPGDFGESAWHGTDTVEVVWGFGLPFFEGWDNGTFSFQGWRFNDQGENWVINSQIGDPEPSAEFTWDPLLELDYTSTLTSNPINADMLTEGSIFFDFDLMLDDRNSTGLEIMKVEVYNGSSWTEVASFANNGSFDFTTSHIDITNYSMGRVFQVRFNATGQNSFDIVSWFVDNIYIYRECAAPEDVMGVAFWDDALQQDVAEVCWEAPFIPGPISEWIHWDSGENASGIGLTDGGTFSIAARWDAGQLSDYAGTSITKLTYFPQDDSWTNVTLKIWTGPSAGTMVYEEDVTATTVTGMWNEVTLTAPVLLDVSDELWIGYEVSHTAGGFPAGTDAGPAVLGYGDMISTDGSTWVSMGTDYGLDYNWNIQAYVTEVSSATSVTLIDDAEYNNPSTTLARGAMKEEPVSVTHTDSRDITGFNIYRMGPGEPDYEMYDVVDYVQGQTSYCFIDTEVSQMGETYCYQVTANYASDTDACESAPGMAYELPMNDFVCIVVTSIDDPNASLTSLYPNPAQDMVTVTSSIPMTQLTVTNYVGQVVFTSEMNEATSTVLNTSSYQAGVYLVKIDTETGVVTKRVIISR